MNSSMLAGERRWASQRRGGMTVLGKVAVPKPINLPSQRLENHGLDPNVEIVPKGTVSWGSRSSSSASNPWTSSSLSPNADGGTVSPTHCSGRPSSGGSGTRPSTAGSDRTHDLVQNAWGSNSRPSSASGTFSSNQSSSASLRPRSAENRPNSSHLSRFAEPVSKSSTAWGSSATAERLGVFSSREDGFSLTSGDFPTLGSDKDNSVKNIESQDHSRPSSASGGINQAKDDTVPNSDVKHEPVNTWRADGPENAEDGIHLSLEKWQGDPHQYPYANNPPQHFDAWRGPPMNGPAAGWYGGPPRGPPFRSHVPPGGFPLDPFPYYHRPQVPPPPLAGPQPVPPPGPRGPHSKNGDLYRPQMPDAYPHPSMPFRPGFYPGPPAPMPFEGYYGPPIGHHNNDRDIPYMGMQAAPPVYNGYPPPNPDIGNPHGRASGRGPAGKMMTEQLEANQREDAYGPKRIHIMSHGVCDQREGGGNRGQIMQPNVSHPGRNHLHVSPRKNEWIAEEDTEEAVFAKRTTPIEHSFYKNENRVHSADSTKVNSFEGTDNVKGVPDNWTNNKSESGPAFQPMVPPLPVASEKDSSLPVANKNSALMNKIDGLNAKFRASDGWNDSPSAYSKGEEGSGSKIVDMMTSHYTGEIGENITGPFEKTPVSTSHEVIVPVGDSPTQPIAVISRRSYHGGHSRADHHGKGKFNGQDVDGWRKKHINCESSSAVTALNNQPAPKTHADGLNIFGGASVSLIVDPEGKMDGDSVQTHDSTDVHSQRAKMRELAKQRALQLQKEEEERIKEQKAKALAKLEELNRRALAGETGNLMAERTQVIGDSAPTEQESYTVVGPMIAELIVEQSGFNIVPGPAVAANSNAYQALESAEVSKNLPLEIKSAGISESNESPLPMNKESHDTNNGASQVNDGGFTRHKRTGYKQKQNSSLQKNVNENSTSDIKSNESPSSDIRPSESNALNASNTVVDPPTQQRRKTNRSNKTKPKLDETPAATALLPVASDADHGNESVEYGGSISSLLNLESPVLTASEPDTKLQAQEVSSSLPNEESQSRSSNQWKPHHYRRLPRNQQAHRFTDKLHGSDTVVWAPVRLQNKSKGSDEASQNSVQEFANSTKDNTVGQNNSKGKRAEMERYVPKPVAKELAQQACLQGACSKENRSAGDRTSSHWQPKSRPHSANNHPQHNQSDNASQLPTVNVENNVAQGSVLGNHQEFNREKKPSPVNAGPYSPSQDPLDSGECNTNTDDHLEHNAPPGSRRNVRQNNRPIRGPNSRGDWSSGHDSRTAFRERQRQNVHYEYQPVGPMKVNKPDKSEEPADAGANNTDQRHRGRGHSHSKRGGSFYRRQSSAAHVGSDGD